MMNNSSTIHQQMMATTTTNLNATRSLWNINNNLMRPPFTSSPSNSSSSTITNNFFLPPSSSYDNNIISPTNNHFFQLHQYNNNNMDISTTTPSSSSWLLDHVHDQPPPFHESLSQLLLSGVYMGEEGKKMENWEEQVMLRQHHSFVDHMKPENSVNSYNNNNNNSNNQINNIPASSPQSCVSTTFSDNNSHLHPRLKNNNLLPVSDLSSECNSTSIGGGALKKAKVQPSSSQSTTTFKVRKEKLGDRITALHQLVSPFGKTDTASVLLEAIGYVRFLHSQIEALSLPYLTSVDANKRHPHFVNQGEKKGIFPEDPGQLVNENCLKRKGGPNQGSNEEAKDLKSRGLCLVPLSCTMNVGSDNGADYWAPALGGGGGGGFQ